MTEALILINTKVEGVMEDVTMKLGEMGDVLCVAMITGSYDIMAVVSSDDLDELILEIRKLDGVKDTNTNVVIAEHVSKGIKNRIVQ